jgi:hypothetical protein
MGVVNPLEEIAADIKAPAPAPKVAVVSPPADDIPEDEKNDGMGDPAFNPSGTPLKPHRWSHFSIPPRHRKFLDKFGHQEFVTRKEIKEWYLDEVNPMIQPASLLTNISHLFRTLSDKGILARKLDGTEGTDDEVWRFIRNNT